MSSLDTLPSKTYDEQFRRDAVAVYEKSDGASLRKISNDLGISGVTLKSWITKYGTSAQPAQCSTGSALSETQRIRALEKRNALLRERATSYAGLLNISRRRRIGDPFSVHW